MARKMGVSSRRSKTASSEDARQQRRDFQHPVQESERSGAGRLVPEKRPIVEKTPGQGRPRPILELALGPATFPACNACAPSYNSPIQLAFSVMQINLPHRNKEET